ncbi:tetratricopeptide repeat protein [Candidatus Poribacteria bacterium]|nr:peptidase MA family metallohydrolase [Candidatus Poribacteria bacterium]MYA68797.1 tetratricopeptide repeat protein [Candidatus Poribacteria bacterium]MYH82344.1 tetratricopeptide repeat protein [Candidatus Poribacteria bacterium]MYK93004.1 tetratricopeptide repeat protein [Candidatus Poribacteria bacterium]
MKVEHLMPLFLMGAVHLRHTNSLALSHFRQATVSYGQACYVEAIQHYLAGLKLGAAHHHYIYADLAKAYEMVGEWDTALACLDIALRLCPDSPTALRRKARILDEKACYDALVCLDDLQKPPPQEFLERLQLDATVPPKYAINSEFFSLTCHSAMHSQTVWNVCRLIHRTYQELGEMLGHYPLSRVPISITNTNGTQLSQRLLPNWASGCYDGSIQLVYCAVSEPVLGILYALLRHEWVHLLIHHLTNGQCPIWLDEGLAQSVARPMFQSERLNLQQAVQTKRLLPLAALSEPFSQLPAKYRKLAYIQSTAIVESLIQQFGLPKIRELLHQLGNDIPTETAIERNFGLTLKEIPFVATD